MTRRTTQQQALQKEAGGGEETEVGVGMRGSRPAEDQQQQQQQPFNATSTFSRDGGEGVHDPLSDWIQERQKSFRDFEQSFSPFTQSHNPRLFSLDLNPPGFDHFAPIHHQPLALERPYFAPPSSMLSARDSQQELSPKAKVCYDEGKFEVEFDVQDFRPEDLSIKTEGDVLIVLAKRETKTETGGSFVSKQFEQRFTLPSGVKPECITSALSKDGILTVTAPREVQRSEIAGYRSPTRGSLMTTAPSNSSSSPSPSPAVYSHSAPTEDEGLPHPRVKYDDDKFQISLDCQHYKPEELDVKVEGNSIIITAKQEIKEAGGTRTRVFEQKFSLPSGVKAEKVSSTFGRDGVLTITAPRGNTKAPIANQSIEERMDRVMSPSSWDDDFGGKRRDSSFSSAIASSRRDDNLRHDSLFPATPFATSGNSPDGISRVQVDDENYKILINVSEFRPEELVIKTVGNTVHFEAAHEEKTSDGHSYVSRNISQSFTLPRGVDPEAVTSSMSREGMLTISAPLPPALRMQNSERLVPIKQH